MNGADQDLGEGVERREVDPLVRGMRATAVRPEHQARDARIAQQGTPEEIRDNPASDFVAAFVGARERRAP